MPEDSVYMPIHVGREGKADIGYTGIIIQEIIYLQRMLITVNCGIYWAWKKPCTDYIGLVHYRRYFYT